MLSFLPPLGHLFILCKLLTLKIIFGTTKGKYLENTSLGKKRSILVNTSLSEYAAKGRYML